jgi:hypothetical protein
MSKEDFKSVLEVGRYMPVYTTAFLYFIPELINVHYIYLYFLHLSDGISLFRF